MKICFFGSSLVSSYWNGAATYYRGILKALSALGHEIAFYEPDAFERQSHRDIANPEWAEVVVYPATSEGWQRSLEHAVASADLLVKASGVGVFDRELEVAVAETPTRARRVYWDVDAPATLDEIAANPAHHLRKAMAKAQEEAVRAKCCLAGQTNEQFDQIRRAFVAKRNEKPDKPRRFWPLRIAWRPL